MNPRERNVYIHRSKKRTITSVLTNKGFYITPNGLLSEEEFLRRYKFVEKYNKSKGIERA